MSNATRIYVDKRANGDQWVESYENASNLNDPVPLKLNELDIGMDGINPIREPLGWAPPFVDEDGNNITKYEDGVAVEMTEEDIATRAAEQEAAKEAAEKAKQDSKSVGLKTVENRFIGMCDQLTGSTAHVKLGFDELNAIIEQIADQDVKLTAAVQLLAIDAEAKREGGLLWWDDCAWHTDIL